MSTSRRPGRLQRIASDSTPLNSTRPDIASRIGWLLAMSRLHHPDPAFSDGRQFVQALRDAGVSASRSLISRWESGEIPVSYEGMSGYEQVLGLEAGRISSLSGYVRAAIPGVKARVIRPQLDPGTREFALRLDDLLDLAEAGQAQGRDWQELGWHMAAAPLVHLRGSTWETITGLVVNQLPRSVKVTYRQYSTAAMNLASIPRAQHFMTEAIARYITAPGVQVLTNPIGLLDRLPTRGAAKLVLDLIDDPPTETVFAMAVWVASQKVAKGDFTPEERTRLDMAVLRLWRANPAKASEDLAELIAGLPEGLRSTLTSAAMKAGRRKLGYVVETGEELAAPAARTLSHELAEAARSRVPQQGSYEEDVMLPRLVREALFHRDSERRHLAALLVSASPFGDAVADVLLALLERQDCPPLVRVRAATLARYLSNDVHRMRMLRFLEDKQDGVGIVVAQGIGHMTFSELSDQVLRSSLQETWSLRERAKLYALGMSGSPGLDAILRSRNAPEWQQEAARWWRAQGPAIRR
ncbi:MAG TPA: hypothetical protein VF049_16760 [Nocardioidaceae bacterium]|jgi:transcriptional regulator with XRE-family HTH domain